MHAIATHPAVATPKPTKLVLVVTLALTLLGVAEVVRRALGGELGARTTSYFLIGLSLLFGLRVAGQVLVLLRAPAWLPPMQEWNLMPYRLLLPVQLVFCAVMAAIDYDVFRGSGSFGTPAPQAGRFLIGFSCVYAASMVVRYAVRMRRRPEARWFGGTIPMVFHVVLAAFLFTLGAYHASD